MKGEDAFGPNTVPASPGSWNLIGMPLILYAHPFAAYCWKVLIALYENGTPFRYRMVDDAAGFAELAALWPLRKFPVLKDGEVSVIESSVIIEHLNASIPRNSAADSRRYRRGPQGPLHGSIL